MTGRLTTLNEVGKITERIIMEILEAGISSYYEKLMHGRENKVRKLLILRGNKIN